MNNKQKLNNLRDYAELAWASYFYFDLDGYTLENDNSITTNEITSLNYSGKMGGKKEKIGKEYHFISKRKLNGDFSEIQAQNFTKRYRIYFHQANTIHGFSATLFYDTQENRFVVGFRGTEGAMDYLTNFFLTTTSGNMQKNSLLNFLLSIKYYLYLTYKPIIFTGHSLGGYLAQWALIYCDKLYKDILGFSPSEVYTFNAPSIYGWNFPNPIINPNIIKILQEILDKRSIDISNKLIHIYDNGGIKLIASAQYGAINRLPINTGENSHSIIPLTQILYLYSYVLELSHNEDKIKDKNLKDTLAYLNEFVKAIYKNFNPLSMNINAANRAIKINHIYNQTPNTHQNLKNTSYLSTFIEHILYITGLEQEIESDYIKLHTNEDNLIDKIILLRDREFYPRIIPKEELEKLDKQCSLAEKRAIFKCQTFVIVDKDDKEVLNEENTPKLLKYNSNSTQILLALDNEEYFSKKLKQMVSFYNDEKLYSLRIEDLNLSSNNTCVTQNEAYYSSTIHLNKENKEFYIFANNKDCIDCKEIYIRASQRLGINLEELQTYTPSIFFNEFHLLGSSELPNNPFYFGELNKDKSIKQDKPSYYFSPKDEESGLGRLSIFYKNNELFLLNYSLNAGFSSYLLK